MAYSIGLNYGCGKSYKWESLALDIAREMKEDCPHLNVFTIEVSISRVDLSSRRVICIVSCPDCTASYAKTSEKLTEVFNKFYGVK